MLQKDYVLGILSRGVGKCTRKCLLDSSLGLIDISEIKVGDTVCTKNGMEKVIDKWIEPKASARIIKYGKAIDSEVHYQHKFYIFDTEDFSYKFVEAQHLDLTRHFMPIKAKSSCWGSELLSEGFIPNTYNSKISINKNADLDDGLAYLCHIGPGRQRHC